MPLGSRIRLQTNVERQLQADLQQRYALAFDQQKHGKAMTK